MAAPNQLQQNGLPGSFYTDQHIDKVLQLHVPGNTNIYVEVKFQFHRLGRTIFFRIDATGNALGDTVGQSQLINETGTPGEFLPSVDTGSVSLTIPISYSAGALNHLGRLILNSAGQLTLIPYDQNTSGPNVGFATGLSISSGQGFYFQ